MKKLIFLSLILNAAIASAQNEQDKIAWQEDNPLEWEYFKGAPNMSSSFHAETSSGISHSFSVRKSGNNIDFDYEVNSFFNPHSSWVKEGERSEYLLGHEQLHFDITELHARKLRKALSEYQITRNYKKELQEIYRQIQSQSDRMQNQFDAETGHSLNKEAELKWREFIKSELEKLKDYSS